MALVIGVVAIGLGIIGLRYSIMAIVAGVSAVLAFFGGKRK